MDNWPLLAWTVTSVIPAAVKAVGKSCGVAGDRLTAGKCGRGNRAQGSFGNIQSRSGVDGGHGAVAGNEVVIGGGHGNILLDAVADGEIACRAGNGECFVASLPTTATPWPDVSALSAVA